MVRTKNLMIQNFIEEPDYADFLLEEVMKDGDSDEIALVQSWYDEAKTRTFGLAAQA